MCHFIQWIKVKRCEHYFNTKDFSIAVNCELKLLQMPVVSKIEDYFLVYKL